MIALFIVGEKSGRAAFLQQSLGGAKDHRAEIALEGERLSGLAQIDQPATHVLQVQAVDPALRLTLRFLPAHAGG